MRSKAYTEAEQLASAPFMLAFPATVVASEAHLKHNDRIAPYDLQSGQIAFLYVALDSTHHHPDPHFFPASLLLYRFVQHDIQEDLLLVSPAVSRNYRLRLMSRETNVVATQHTNHFSATVQLDEQPFIEILSHTSVSIEY